ncbi:copper amine oxidase N-terminal domain-containing protein [Paenibacillus sp. P96]|uniref:Copper amine oxidase N-terminal domain-containing protein n=1 Tax=Paenibacillus zeirhizosphaerae TaxID=2987519 RepID=A0ABT9FX59_9BACL|nr:copper amine oxidase N-terminal domain-containing protein [Paenibacillus sp. P96]MDP4099057.1 copper amine oxidase N-terminal domain-containing protein [Paenibacillus sp. P96]
MKLKKWLAAPLILLLVVLTGCQAVGGFDVNQGLLGTLKVKPQESSSSLSFHVEPAGSASAEDREIIDFINSVSISVYEAKIQSEDVVSAKGVFQYKDVSLPFAMSMDEAGLAFELEGSKKPYYIGLKQDEALAGLPEGFDPYAYKDKINDLVLEAAGLFIEHSPNPADISVDSVTEEVNGEQVKLTKLSAQLTGEELVQLVKPLLQSLSQDEEGLKKLISQGLDLAAEIAAAVGEEETVKEGLSEFGANREEIVNTLFTKTKDALDQAVSQYDAGVSLMYTQVPELKTVLGPNTVLKTDLYFDENNDLRQERTELTVALPETEDLPITSFTFLSESETWNVNGAVTADKVDISDGVIHVDGEDMTPGETLRNFDSGSKVYDILQNDLLLTHKEIVIDPDDGYYALVSKKGTTMIPLRDLANELDADLKWDAAAKQITVTDDITEETFVVKNGMKRIVVGERTIALPQAVFTDEYGTMYVPLRQAAAALGADVSSDDGLLVIERD